MNWGKGMHALLSFMLAGGTLAGTAFAQTNDSSNSNVRPITNVSNVINTEAVYKKIGNYSPQC
ncbi:hypothetical protein P9204_06635 [Geobacillus stearothermophilus]|nr:hypothetical protein [Geobacillus stearothermophilus]